MMKKRSTFKKYTYLFQFFIEGVSQVKGEDGDSKIAAVKVSVMSTDKTITYWNGIIRVRLNEFGIYPIPEDLKNITGPNTMKKMLLTEIRRYIKPQKPFL
ncbi:hypothetical protein [Peribacillus sp. SCS-155]|uniref:hypothetical protein n=1 Tax=Peribacillus sedimenti TaxID=3115297 RepID=UPI0039066A6D